MITPLVILAVAGLAYLVTIRVLGELAARGPVSLPGELEPLIVAILLGVVTDYSVLMLSSLRDVLPSTGDSRAAAREVVRQDGPIVAVAGVAVMSGTAALLSANFQLFRAFGPALTGTVFIGMVASLTLIPAVMAILGRWIFLPSRRTRAPGDAGLTVGLLRIIGTRARAGAAAGLCLGLLLLTSIPLSYLRLDLSFTQGLPAATPVRLGATVLSEAGVRGITAPTELLVRQAGVTTRRAALNRLQRELQRQPGVAAVLGPQQNPLPSNYGVVLSRDHTAARFVLIYDSDPLAATAGAQLRTLIGRSLPSSATAISTAGLTLAASFVLVAIIPLATFRQIAFTIGAGLVLDTFLVRPVLTPSLLTVLGRASSWPGRRFAPP